MKKHIIQLGRNGKSTSELTSQFENIVNNPENFIFDKDVIIHHIENSLNMEPLTTGKFLTVVATYNQLPQIFSLLLEQLSIHENKDLSTILSTQLLSYKGIRYVLNSFLSIPTIVYMALYAPLKMNEYLDFYNELLLTTNFKILNSSLFRSLLEDRDPFEVSRVLTDILPFIQLINKVINTADDEVIVHPFIKISVSICFDIARIYTNDINLLHLYLSSLLTLSYIHKKQVFNALASLVETDYGLSQIILQNINNITTSPVKAETIKELELGLSTHLVEISKFLMQDDYLCSLAFKTGHQKLLAYCDVQVSMGRSPHLFA